MKTGPNLTLTSERQLIPPPGSHWTFPCRTPSCLPVSLVPLSQDTACPLRALSLPRIPQSITRMSPSSCARTRGFPFAHRGPEAPPALIPVSTSRVNTVSVKSQLINSLGFGGHSLCLKDSPLAHSTKAAINNNITNVCGNPLLPKEQATS